MSGPRKVALSVVWALGLFLVAEFALQLRSQIRYGASVFNVLSAETTYQFHEDLQLKLLRPSAVIQGSQAVIETNSMGLRSPELPVEKGKSDLRVVLLGASSVMGTYTRANEEIVSYRLEAYLDEAFPDRRIDVINAGIAGYGLQDQRRMFEELIVPMKPDLLIWYSGFNDISGYCRKQSKSDATIRRLPQLQLPSWLLSIELVTKNSLWLRTTAASKQDVIDPESINLERYRNDVDALLSSVALRKIPMLVATNARSFRSDMPMQMQLALSETARYYNSCFDLAGLHKVYDRHNDILAERAQAYNFPVLKMDQLVPGGREYFGDATHFSVKGSDYVARLIFRELQRLHALEGPVRTAAEKQP
ncbi:MAG: hypothetical protein R3E57_05370 [Porticoccaceae bacterium]